MYYNQTADFLCDIMVLYFLFRKEILPSYTNEDIVVRFPKGKYITDYKWISVWCRQAVVSLVFAQTYL